MVNSNHARRSAMTASVLIALLLLGVALLAMRAGPTANTKGQPNVNGPLAKVAQWIEPPPRDGPEPDFESLIELITSAIPSGPSTWTPEELENNKDFYGAEEYARWKPILAATSDFWERIELYERRWGDHDADAQ